MYFALGYRFSGLSPVAGYDLGSSHPPDAMKYRRLLFSGLCKCRTFRPIVDEAMSWNDVPKPNLTHEYYCCQHRHHQHKQPQRDRQQSIVLLGYREGSAPDSTMVNDSGTAPTFFMLTSLAIPVPTAIRPRSSSAA